LTTTPILVRHGESPAVKEPAPQSREREREKKTLPNQPPAPLKPGSRRLVRRKNKKKKNSIWHTDGPSSKLVSRAPLASKEQHRTPSS
jgi:hypothetical protein